MSFTGQHLVVVQTVLDEHSWRELQVGMADRGHDVVHVLLDACPRILHDRIDDDPEGHDIRSWRHDHVDVYVAARPWLVACAELVLDTEALGPQACAATVFARVKDGIEA